MEYDEPSVLTEYVCRHCVPQMTMFEREGLKVVYAREKVEPAQSARVRTMIMRRWVDQADPAVIAALSAGVDAFREAVRDRVLRDHPELINRCPICKRIARTPRAKQCRWCFHDWHQA